MRSSAFLAIAASVVIPVFVAASPTPADAFEPRPSGPDWRRDALDVSGIESNSNNRLHSRVNDAYSGGDFLEEGVRDVIGSTSTSNNQPHSRDDDGSLGCGFDCAAEIDEQN
ncbi:hypothetical protein SCP_1403480 [Sparassis crispa]|uniref:Secreted protein n=1 Tax=Sparassis crispa TaxID=139825 RepID=A0A401H3L6_9APHY|nr:hypothetical protein SCP_1403480 [Sparassis crispa]GBE88940.1 hypothetical protein SCP_1403480 [Sparassis crispa]